MFKSKCGRGQRRVGLFLFHVLQQQVINPSWWSLVQRVRYGLQKLPDCAINKAAVIRPTGLLLCRRMEQKITSLQRRQVVTWYRTWPAAIEQRQKKKNEEWSLWVGAASQARPWMFRENRVQRTNGVLHSLPQKLIGGA